MAFKEFETEELYNAEIDSIVTERVNKAMEDKNPWLSERLNTARNNAIKEANEAKDAEYAEKLAGYADYDDIKSRLEESDKKLAGYADHDKKLSEAQAESMRLRAALKYGIDLEDADRLRGTTLEEIEEDAKGFSERHSGRKQTYPQKNAESGAVDGVTAYLRSKYPDTYK